jgi:hypothetical protein
MVRRALLTAVTVPVLAVAANLLAFAAAIAVALLLDGVGVLVSLIAWALVPATWQLLAGRTPAPPSPPGVPHEAGALRALVAAECRSLGVAVPDQIRITAGRELELRRDGAARMLVVGLAALAEHDHALLRLGVADVLALDADGAHRRLTRMRGGMIARALAIGEAHPYSSAPWRRLAGVAAHRLDAAIAARTLLVAARLDVRLGSEAAARADKFDFYWSLPVLMCLDAGFRPPIAAGWRRVLELEGPSALALLDEPVDDIEARVLAAAGTGRARELVPVAWERMGEAVLLPAARAEALDAAWLAEWQVGDAVDAAAMAAGDEQALEQLGLALVVAMADAGWAVTVTPPMLVELVGEEASVEPFGLVYSAADGSVEAAPWRAFAEEMGLAQRPLAPNKAATAGAPELERIPVATPRAKLELVLHGSKKLRRRTAAVIVPMLLICLPFSLGTPLGLALTYPGISPGGRLALAGFGLALSAGLCWWAWMRWRLAFRRGRLLIDADRLRLEHPGLLRHPYEIPRSLVRAAVGDARGGRNRVGRHTRFGLAMTPWETPDPDAWLWVAGEYPAVPFLGVEIDVPNVVLVFERPIAGPVARSGAGHAPLPHEALGGLMLAVEEPADLEAAFTALGFAPSLTPADLAVVVAAHEGDFVAR